MPIRIKDVARHADVSSATVSRVLADKPHVSDAVRQRVLQAVEELGYQPSRIARSLRVQHARIIGLIISDIQNAFFTALVRAVEDVAYEQQYAVFLCNSDEDIEKETLYVNLMLGERVAGVVITPTREYDNPSRRLIEAGIPVVAVDRRMRDLAVDTVVVDNTGATFDLVSHLIADGHRRIGAIVGPETITTGRERYEGYVLALEAHGLSVSPQLVRRGLPKEDVGYRFAGELLDLPQPPGALFTGNMLLTIGVLRAINERGLHIPHDIALGAFDEMPWTSVVKPGLTVVAQSAYDLGHEAAGLLFKRIKDRARPPEEIVLKPTLIIRQSCADHEAKEGA
jgi:DNA-binding LacI/PurR family transcriptional regulator